MSNKIRVGIIGGAGYTGGETIRLLINHPHIELVFVQSRSQAGKKLETVHSDLSGETELKFSDSFNHPVDVIFLCLGHGESRKFLQENHLASSISVIDLSHDFRVNHTIADREFVYGLPEINRKKISAARNIANPGCFATAIQLALLPLAKRGVLPEVFATGITGSTGAGQKLQESTHFTWRANNISPYKTLVHQHLDEIRKTVGLVQPGYARAINFIPWRGDFTRGIFVSTMMQIEMSLDEIEKVYKDFYGDHPFTHVSDQQIDLKQVVNTNKCLIALEKAGDKLVVHSAIDNLLKGASGQAVQNMNLMFGLEETTGLKLKSSVF